VIIRKTRPEDLGLVAAVHARSIADSCSDHYTPAQIRAWTGVLQPAVYESAIRDKHFIVACDGDAILGLGILDLEVSEINAVYVDPDRAGQGVGGRILSELEETAGKHGFTQLTVFSTLNARHFYLKNGYRPHKSATHTLPGGLELECIEMHKRLG
jgi:GNAT superfamily N-acetyltransferase